MGCSTSIIEICESVWETLGSKCGLSTLPPLLSDRVTGVVVGVVFTPSLRMQERADPGGLYANGSLMW